MRHVDLIVVGYPERLVADHDALVRAATAAGFDARVVAPSRLGLVIDDAGERVAIDGEVWCPRVAVPRGVNRPWPMVRHILEVWERQGCLVVPTVTAADVCSDKIATTRALAAAGVPVLPTVGVVPGDGVSLAKLVPPSPTVIKPARASKARGVLAFDSPEDAQASLRTERALIAGMVDHHLVQPLASTAGVDYRVVVADGSVVALTRRRAAPDQFITNAPGALVTDLDPTMDEHHDVVEVAVAAAHALALPFAGVDVIRHDGRAVVLEVNAWPGMAATVRHDQLVNSLLAVIARRLVPN